MTEPRVIEVQEHGTGLDMTVTDGARTHTVWVPLGHESAQAAAIAKWRAIVAQAERQAQYQPGCRRP